jgi:hypothetical protein
MKKIFLMGCIAMSLFSMISCNKNDDASLAPESDPILSNVSITSSESEDALNATDELADGVLESRSNPSCPTITSTAPRGTFPNVITFDFGSGCTTDKGRFHSGKIIVEQSDSMIHDGAVRKTTFVDYGIDSLKMKNGVVTLTNNGKDANGNRKFTRKITDMSVTGPKGELLVNASHTRTQIKGADTPDKGDDVWKIQGETIGSTPNDKVVYSAVITEALIRKNDCPFIVSGKETFTRKGRTAILDFGDGSCDRFATLTLENGNKIIIVLKPRF